MTNQDILDALERRAPFGTAEEWDNPGLLIGSGEDPARRALIALDVTPEAADAAEAIGADVIVTHHPVIFSPLRRLDSTSLPYRLAAAGIGVISAHTNLDKAAGGVNDTLAELIGLTDIRPTGDGMGRVGTLPTPMTAGELADLTARVLGTDVRVSPYTGETIRTAAVCGGSGGDFIPAVAAEADAYITGEVRHHQWLDAAAAGLTVIEAGHYATEEPIVHTLARWLGEDLPELTVTVYDNGSPYLFRHGRKEEG